MKTNWRIMTMALVLIFCFSLFAGCGQTTTQSNTTTGQAQTEATKAADASATAATTDQAAGTAATAEASKTETSLPISAEKVELTMWYPFPPFFASFMKSPDDGTFFPELEKRTNVHIKMVQVSTETLMETFNLMIASGEYPDIIQNATSLYNGGGDKAIKDGVIIRLNELIEKNMPNLTKILNTNDTVKKELLTDEGNIAAFSMIQKESALPDYGPFIRQDWLDDLGLKAPVTYDDYYNVLKAFKEKKNAVAPLWLSPAGVPNGDFLTAGYDVMGFLYVANGRAVAPWYQVDGKMKFGLIEPGFKEYLTMINKWYTEGLFNKDFSSYQESAKDPNEAFLTTGKTGLWYADQWSPDAYKSKATDPKFHAVGITDAVKKAGDKTHFAMQAGMTSQNNAYAITTSCKNPDLAAKWVDYWYSDEGSLLANYGIEGQTFDYVDNKPVFKDIVSKNPDLVLNLAISKYTMQFGPFVNDYTRFQQGYTQEQKDAATTWASNRDSAYSIPAGMVLNVAESETYSLKFGDINTYASEMILKFITGKEPISKFDEFTAKIKSMGIDDCIAVYQTCYDRYMSRK
ncbi:MAG: extracellular solute-binding protein [Clostridiales bacterium]|nr:extracellular solute-binding protein [Clostridiales bacterium]